MIEDVVIRPMTEEFVLWRCLHDGPLSRESIELPTHPAVDWPARRATNVPLLRALMRTYGTCAMLAWDADRVVGFVRFYPKGVLELEAAGHLCLQQAFPNGPSGDILTSELPTLEKLEDRTLVVHCLMTGSPKQEGTPISALASVLGWPEE